MPVRTRQTFPDRSTVSLAAETQPAAYNLDRLRYDYSQIAEEHRERVQYATVAIQDHMRRATQSVIEAGKELLGIREILPSGKFIAWVETEFGISERMAQHMMNAGREFGANPKRVTGFSDSAIYLLAAPSMPDDVREEILAEAEATGQPATRKEIAARKPKQPKPKPQPAPEPATPDDVAQAGYTIEQHDSGAYHWRVPDPSGMGGSYGTLHATPDGAVEEARHSMARGDVFYQSVADATPEPAAEPPKRGTPEYAGYRAQACRAAIVQAEAWLVTLDEIAELTGLYGQVSREKRSVREWIAALQREAGGK